ncbi:MAG: NUDIX hydrolase [Pirellulaceae bacterium]|nr:NUDIX hydrolase [Pirellulaceae bacterium]
MSDPPRVLLETALFRVVELTRTGPAGQVVRQVVQHSGAVTIIPEVDRDHVCLIRNFRLSVDQTLLELPAGTREAGESPEVTAARELTEETGFRAERLELLTRFYMSPGILSEQMHLYLATGLTPGAADLQAGEQIENHVVRWDEALRLVANGTIQDAKTLVGLLLYYYRRQQPQ